MKLTLLTALLTLTLPVPMFAQQNQILSARALYYDALTSSEIAKSFYEQFSTVDESSNPILLGYKGMASFMLANHAKLPTAKLKHFIDGKTNLEKAIKLAPENLELHYLRFTVQTSAPEFLGYRSDIRKDKIIIFGKLDNSEVQIEPDLRRRILEYLLRNRYCSGKEKKKVRRLQDMLTKKES